MLTGACSNGDPKYFHTRELDYYKRAHFKNKTRLYTSIKLFGFFFFFLFLKNGGREFPGLPVVRTPRFHCRGHGFQPLGMEQRSCKPCGTAKNFFLIFFLKIVLKGGKNRDSYTR